MVMAAAILIARTGTSTAATFTVTTPFDSGPGSLREAITRANETAGRDTIVFDIPSFDSTPTGPGRLIQLVTPLPTVTDPVVIDATTQPGFSVVDGIARPVVEVRGTGGEGQVEFNGIVITAGGSTVRGLSLTQFTNAIVLASNDNVVELNWIGQSEDGLFRANRNGVGVQGNGNTVGRGNVIVNNQGDGVSITGSNNIVIGNLIGIAADDNDGLNFTGVYMGITAGANRIGGTDPLDRNVISGNRIGVYADSTTVQNLILGNYIGTTRDGARARGNGTGIEDTLNTLSVYSPLVEAA